MKTLLWIIAIAVLQGIFAAAAKKAKANQAKANQAGANQAGAEQAKAGASGVARRKRSPASAHAPSGNPAANSAATAEKSLVPPAARPGSRASVTGKPVVLARGGEAPRPAVARDPRGAPIGGARAADTLSGGVEARLGAPTGQRGVPVPMQSGRAQGASAAGSAPKRVVQAPPKPGAKPGAKPSTRPIISAGASSPSRPHATGSVAGSVARVHAAEARITGLPGIEIATPMIDAPRPTAATGIGAALRNRDEIRRAVLLTEILGAPRALRPYGA